MRIAQTICGDKKAMDDLISRQAAIETTCYNCTEKETCNGICDDTDRLRELPTIDPVKHARWISDTGGFFCSNCKHHTDDDEIGNWDILFGKWVYCPHCGANMDDE